MPRTSPQHEHTLNVKLAEQIQRLGLTAYEEERHGAKRHDVHCVVGNVPVVLEAAIDDPRDAIKDADRRLAQGATSLAFAIVYPPNTLEITPATLMTWTLRTRDVTSGKAREGAPAAAAWSKPGTVRELAEAVLRAPDVIGDADMAADVLRAALEQAAQGVAPDWRRALARELDLPEPKGKTASDRDTDYLKRTKRAMLVLATSIMFQHQLGHIPGWRSPDLCADDADPVGAFQLVWRFVLDVDYAPIFETAQVALSAIAGMPSVNDVVRELVRRIGGVVRVNAGRRDLLGRVFHRILDTARYDGSYYTSSAAATLLAALALPQRLRPTWDHDAIADLRVCDPASGTGTLLVAAVERLNQLKRGATELDQEMDDLLAQILVEDVVYAYDTNLTATHLTASTLGMIHPRAPFERMNVNQTPFGMCDDPEDTDANGNPNENPRKVPRIGSLEFLYGEGMLLKPWPNARNVDKTVDDEGGEQDSGWEVQEPPPMDLVIMNPPFTRQDLRHDQMGAEAEALMKAREKQLLAGKERSAARLHSSGGMFNVLATKLLKKDTGTLAMILPTIVATSPGNADMREHIAEQFRIDTVVSSHDPKRIYFSENTNIGEVLIIARREGKGEPTRFVNLARNPSTPIDAMNLARVLEDGSTPDHATIQLVEAERVASGDWYAVNFYNPWLVSAYRDMAAQLVRLDAISEVGPIGRIIGQYYRKSDSPTASGRRALWHHKTDVTTSMRAETDVYVEPINGKERVSDRYWEQRSRLLLPERLRLNTTRVSTTMLADRTVGQLWVPCRPADDETAMALCAWFNSTPGLLAMLAERDNKVPARPKFALATLRSLRVPDFGALPEARASLAASYEALKDATLQPLPGMTRDPIRAQLDATVAQALGYDPEWIARVRAELAREPSITNQPLYDKLPAAEGSEEDGLDGGVREAHGGRAVVNRLALGGTTSARPKPRGH